MEESLESWVCPLCCLAPQSLTLPIRKGGSLWGHQPSNLATGLKDNMCNWWIDVSVCSEDGCASRFGNLQSKNAMGSKITVGEHNKVILWGTCEVMEIWHVGWCQARGSYLTAPLNQCFWLMSATHRYSIHTNMKTSEQSWVWASALSISMPCWAYTFNLSIASSWEYGLEEIEELLKKSSNAVTSKI